MAMFKKYVEVPEGKNWCKFIVIQLNNVKVCSCLIVELIKLVNIF